MCSSDLVRLYPEANATSVTVTFRGVVQAGANSDWRWGLVATDSAVTTPRYSAMQKGSDAQLTFCVNPGEALFLVVMATPSVQQHVNWDQLYNTLYRYPYMVELKNAWPSGFKSGTQDACPSGLARHSNGGGCVKSGVPASVYVGPYAQVVGGTVSGSARIEDHAVVVNGTVSGGTVGNLSVLTNGFNVSGGKAATTFYPLGFFEGSQGLSGSAQLVGDVEYRGSGLNKSSGTYYGFVDSSTASASSSDLTLPGPYTWRP